MNFLLYFLPPEKVKDLPSKMGTENKLKYLYRMKFLKSPWLLILSLVITLIGIITGKFLFLFLILPLSLFNFGKKGRDE